MTSSNLTPLPTDQRDRSRLQALVRKRRQREKQRKAGALRLELAISKGAWATLEWAGDLTGGSAKEQAEYLIRCTHEAYRQQLKDLASQAGKLWRDAQPFIAYAAYLSEPGRVFRIHDRVLHSDDWLPLQEQLTAVHTRLARRGWSKARINAFLKRCAREVHGDAAMSPRGD